MKGVIQLKRKLLRSIGLCSLLITGLVSGAAKFWFYFEPNE